MSDYDDPREGLPTKSEDRLGWTGVGFAVLLLVMIIIAAYFFGAS